MNVYDFDKTIYKYDSSVRFYLFCVKRNKLLLLHSPMQFFYLICYLLKLLSTKQYKQKSYTFLSPCDSAFDSIIFKWLIIAANSPNSNKNLYRFWISCLSSLKSRKSDLNRCIIRQKSDKFSNNSPREKSSSMISSLYSASSLDVQGLYKYSPGKSLELFSK